MKKKMKKAVLGNQAEKLLFWTLPIVLIQMLIFVCFLFSKSRYELAGCGEIISVMIEQIGKGLLLSVFGALIFDILEKKEKNRT